MVTAALPPQMRTRSRLDNQNTQLKIKASGRRKTLANWLGFKRRARRRSKSAKAVIKRCVAERQEKALKKSSSSGLFKAMKPTDKWLKRLRRSLLADEGGLSFFAVMCGCWWPCGGLRRSGAVQAKRLRVRVQQTQGCVVAVPFFFSRTSLHDLCDESPGAGRGPARPRAKTRRLSRG